MPPFYGVSAISQVGGKVGKCTQRAWITNEDTSLTGVGQWGDNIQATLQKPRKLTCCVNWIEKFSDSIIDSYFLCSSNVHSRILVFYIYIILKTIQDGQLFNFLKKAGKASPKRSGWKNVAWGHSGILAQHPKHQPRLTKHVTACKNRQLSQRQALPRGENFTRRAGAPFLPDAFTHPCCCCNLAVLFGTLLARVWWATRTWMILITFTSQPAWPFNTFVKSMYVFIVF